MNETTTGAPLTATVGERLGDDPHVKEVRDAVEHAAGPPEPGAATREGTTASRAARQAHARRPGARGPGGAGAPRAFPWAALALAAVGWALASGIVRGLGARASRGVRRLVAR